MNITIRAAGPEDAEAMLNLYQQFAGRFVGPPPRRVSAYRRMLRSRRVLAWLALNENGRPVGYVLAHFYPGRREARIDELVVSLDDDGRRVAQRLLEVAVHRLMELEPAVIYAPTGSSRDPIYERVLPKMGFFSVDSSWVFMLAVIDPAIFLRDVFPTLAHRLRRLEGWSGLLQLECEGESLFILKDGANVERIIWTGRSADVKIRLSRKLLVQLLFGVVRPSKALEEGELEVCSSLTQGEVRRLLETIFPEVRFVIMDVW